MSRRGYVPERGDVVWLMFDPQGGHEQSGRRPGIVLSPATYNGRTGMALCCPITSQVKGYPFEVLVPSGLKITGAILADHIKNIDWRLRGAKFLCKLPDETLAEASEKLMSLIISRA